MIEGTAILLFAELSKLNFFHCKCAGAISCLEEPAHKILKQSQSATNIGRIAIALKLCEQFPQDNM